jgi:hypothetical protein
VQRETGADLKTENSSGFDNVDERQCKLPRIKEECLKYMQVESENRNTSITESALFNIFFSVCIFFCVLHYLQFT